MTAVAPPKQRWDTGEYLSIRSASFDNGTLRIVFADGDNVDVPVSSLSSKRFVAPDWSAVTAGPLWITVPTADGEIEISWLAIRLLTDPEFRTYWDERSEGGAASNDTARQR
jgi:hypothetical protein